MAIGMVTSWLVRIRGAQKLSVTCTEVNGTGPIGYDGPDCAFAEFAESTMAVSSDKKQIIFFIVFDLT